MKSRLPSNLNPTRFKDVIDVYCDDYEDRYSITRGRWGFLIDNKVPFTMHVAEGVNGKELYDRRLVVRLLRIAQRIHRDTGHWPQLSSEWAEMCPGGLFKLDVTSLAAIHSSAPQLPEVLETVSARLDKMLNSPDAPFSQAENHYRDELNVLPSFNDAVRTIQREFDEHPLCVLNTNTKTRRLRFITVLARFAEMGVDSQRLANAALDWASQHTDALQAHTDSKGAILSSTGLRSVLPYSELAKELGILTKIGRGVTLTNTGRALVLSVPPQEVFSLRIEERLYFLFELLVHDRDIIWPLLVYLRGKHRKRDVRREFPEVYKQYLNRLRGYCGTARSRRQVDDALERIAHWQRPQVYMEHVVDPRLSWLVDLELCQFEKDEVSLTEAGTRVAEMFEEPCEEDVIPVTKEFLRRRFFKAFAPHLVPNTHEPLKKPSRSELARLLSEYCDIVWRHTKSLAPNRIVASTLLRYAGIKLFVEHRIAADFRDLIAFLTGEETASEIPWRLRWQAAQDDGYLTRANTVSRSN